MAKITREAAINLFAALGINSAGKWNAKRMQGKLAKVNEMVDEGTTFEDDVNDTLATCLAAIEDGDAIEVVASLDDAAEPAQDTQAAEPAAELSKKPARGKGKSTPKTPKAEKPAPAEKPEKPEPKVTTPGVRKTATRPFIAGQVIKAHGLEAGVTAEMIAEVDAAYGKANPRETEFCLRNAWHAIRGYIE